MSISRHHAEWLSLLDISGPFLSLKVLNAAFPQGLDAPDADVARELRLAYEEWLDSAFGTRSDAALHRAWAEWVLRRVLEMPGELLVRVSGIGNRVSEAQAGVDIGDVLVQRLTVTVPEYGETLRPDFVVAEPGDGGKIRLLVQIVPPGQDLEKAPARAAWQASPATRMMTLLRGAGVRLGLLTNGEQWMLVDRPADENMTTGFASWYAQLWLDEPLTLRAFRSLLGARRFFGVPDSETLEALLSDSANDRQEVTDQLGYQVRRAVELLVQAIDLADQNEGRALLQAIPETQLYEAALTVMMRLVFLLFAEEQNLLLLGDDIYDQHYAVSTLMATLREAADRMSEEVLERRYDAWARLLAIVRAVYGGFSHDRLTMPAYGGGLFDPDRFPFLEGRQPGTSWLETPANPLRISNRVVLHLLEALQVLRMKMRDGAPTEPRRLSFRALDIEQIGHVYEGLLDHTAVRADEPVLGLAGTRDQEPEIALARLEELAGYRVSGIGYRVSNLEDGKPETRNPEPATPDKLLAFLVEQTGRTENALKRAWAAPLDAFRAALLRAACGNDDALYDRVLPFAGLVRDDDYGRPVVIPAGSVYVTAGAERRSTGTHYTPRSLTEPIVQHTLEPLVYLGPAEGKAREEWTLRPAADLLQLTVCDMAMGSGAFLVQACRYLSERLLEAWAAAEGIGDRVQGIGDRVQGVGDRVQGIGDRVSQLNDGGVADDIAVVSRPDGVAEEHGAGRGDLSAQQDLSEGRAVWPDQPDSQGSDVGSGEHRGGLWPDTSQGVSEPPVDRSWLTAGDRDSSADRGAPGVPDSRPGDHSLGAITGSRPDVAGADALSETRIDDRARGYAQGDAMPYSLHPEPSRRRLITPDGFLTTDPNAAIPADPDERMVFARRLVADRCLYGVDKNPLAVEMAKLSLWLITLAKGQPFSFLDHALRAGDSLLGVGNVRQILNWDLAASDDDRGAYRGFLTQPLERALERAGALRRRIQSTPVRDARDAEQKQRWLHEAEDAMGLVRLAADLLIAAQLHKDKKRRAELSEEFQVRLSVAATAWEDARRDPTLRPTGNRAELAALRREADELLAGRTPFHWPLEFPEAFDEGIGDRVSGMGENASIGAMLEAAQNNTLYPIPNTRGAGFAAVVGNPPFQGGQKITGALGVPYRDYLVEYLANGQRGSADLCAYFFLRGGELVRQRGQLGLIATNTIAQGDTREVGLAQLVAHDLTIPRAVPSRPWPGTAALEVAHVWLRRGNWQANFLLNDQQVNGITPFLTVPGTASGNPYRLKANESKSFQGSIVLGMGFVLEPDEAAELITKDSRNRDVLRTYAVARLCALPACGKPRRTVFVLLRNCWMAGRMIESLVLNSVLPVCHSCHTSRR